MNRQSLVTVVIPTVGGSTVFRECLEALAPDRQAGARIVVVADRSTPPNMVPRELIDLLVPAPRQSGFAVSCNLGLAEVDTELSALVNDDAIVGPDWMSTLATKLLEHPHVASVQGTNLQMTSDGRIDGCGIAWNSRWQPVQIDHDRLQPSSTGLSEVFGASATAALFRHEALIEVSSSPDQIFDPNLHTYYDDVDLAARLRAGGYTSLLDPSTQALHAGGASSEAALRWRYRQLYGNRLLVLARLLGREYWVRLPRILSSDMRDLGRALGQGDAALISGIVKGWQRAAALLAKFAHTGKPLVPASQLAQFRPPASRGAHSS